MSAFANITEGALAVQPVALAGEDRGGSIADYTTEWSASWSADWPTDWSSGGSTDWSTD